MKSAEKNFDGLVRIYRALEFLAFGRDLERARFCFLDQLRDCRDILVLGEGDGRCLSRLVKIAPEARIHCVDASGAMLARASARLEATGAGARVTFEKADAFSLQLPTARYDAVLTLFFLDCFRADQVTLLVGRLRSTLQPRAQWLWADFAMPARGWARWRAQVSIRILYAFFRWQTGLSARVLPPAEAIIRAAGFTCAAEREYQGGFVRTALWQAAGDASR